MGIHIEGDNRPRRLAIAVFPPDYLGSVHVVLRAPHGDAPAVDVTLKWGPWQYERKLAVGDQGVALLFSKTQAGAGQPPLRITLSERLTIKVFTGLPEGVPDDLHLDCNEGWLPV